MRWNQFVPPGARTISVEEPRAGWRAALGLNQQRSRGGGEGVALTPLGAGTPTHTKPLGPGPMYEMKSGDICSSPNWISALIFPESKKKRQFLLVLGLVEMGPNGSL